MILLSTIADASAKRDRVGLREIFKRSATMDIERCDDRKTATLRLFIIEAAVLGTPDFFRTLDACIDAIQRGYHPRDDLKARSVIEVDAAIASAQLATMFGSQPGADSER